MSYMKYLKVLPHSTWGHLSITMKRCHSEKFWCHLMIIWWTEETTMAFFNKTASHIESSFITLCKYARGKMIVLSFCNPHNNFLISRSRCTSYLPILSRHQRRWKVMNLYIAAKVLIRSCFFSRPHLWTTPTQFHDIVLSLLRMLDLTIYILTHAYSHAVHTDWILQRDLSVQKDCYTATLLDA